MTKEAQSQGAFETAKSFEGRVRECVAARLTLLGVALTEFQDQDFPDIVVGDWGIEVKHTKDDKWRTVANSVFEGHRREEVERVFLVYAKMGGVPTVRWARYEDSVVHVRTSHRPRYEVEIDAKRSLFAEMKVSYSVFRDLPEREKMGYIRAYARGRLRDGEQLWWLGEDPENPHSLPLAARLYIKLPNEEKLRLRAEATFLCPEIVKSGRGKDKYNRAALYLLTYHGVLASQVRDLFSAGSVADPGNKKRGGNYVLRALLHLEPLIEEVAGEIGHVLLEDYWGKGAPKSKRGRLREWLRRADAEAVGWRPSDHLFKARKP